MSFNDIRKIKYTFSNGKVSEMEMSDIFRRVTFTEESRNNSSNFEFYVVSDGETPEDVSQRLYGTTSMWWLILMFNNIVDVTNQWPRSVSNITKLSENFLIGNSYFIIESLLIQDDDVIVKRDTTQLGSIDINTFGIVDSYDSFFHKIDIKQSKGTMNGGDEFYVFRGNVDTGYTTVGGFGATACAPQYSGSTYCSQILGPTTGSGINAYGLHCATAGATFGIIKKKTTILDGVSKFEYENNEISPYAGIDSINNEPTGSFYTTENLCGMTSSILYKYIIDNTPSSINSISVSDNIHIENDKNRTIKILSPNIIYLVAEEIDSLLKSDVAPGTTRFVQLLG